MTPVSIRRNLRGPWVVDDDPFEINQFLHPYQGAMYHGIARSNGLSYWPSVAYTFAGSALWEIAGETTPPSRNDQIASGIAGSFLGEPLFRISRLLLERADHGPGVWRTLASVLASPPTGINHVLVGDPAGSLAPDAVPFSDIRVQFGTTAIATGRSRSVSSLALNQPRLALSMDYGYPGNASYRHERPFDYFRIESSVSAEGLEHLSTRGLVAGADYGAGAPRRHLGPLWHLRLLRARRLSLLQHGVLVRHHAASIGYPSRWWCRVPGLWEGATSRAQSVDQTDGRDYHYGVAPQALVNLRLIAGRRAALDLTAREYFVSAVGGFGTGQRDLIFVGDASLAVRVYRRHALGLTYQLAGRSSDFLALPDQTQGAVDGRRVLHVPRVGRLRRGAVDYLQTPMSGVLQDIRYALRAMRGSLGLTFVIVASLAVGIGANTAIFSVINALLLKPLPYPDPERLAVIWIRNPGINIPQDWPSPGSTSTSRTNNARLSRCRYPAAASRRCSAAVGIRWPTPRTRRAWTRSRRRRACFRCLAPGRSTAGSSARRRIGQASRWWSS